MIQTKTLVMALSGFILDMDPRHITSPSGIAPTRVMIKSFNVCKKPTFNASNTIGNCVII